MENPVLARLSRLGAGPEPIWLWTLLTVLDCDRYPLSAWNEALSAALGRRISCPTFRALERRLLEAVCTGN